MVESSGQFLGDLSRSMNPEGLAAVPNLKS
jgi:hypothetical protein